jgi:hypothetical protein
MENDGDACSVCHKPFAHNTRTYGGVTKIGKAALAGECCAAKLDKTILAGLYMARDFEELVSGSGTGPRTPQQIEAAIAAMQQVAKGREDLRADAASRAGVDPAKTTLSTSETAWKADDAEWFEQNPKRTHRLRKPLDGEFPTSVLDGRPHGHHLTVVVRQVRPGMRVRVPFWRHVLENTPDEDATLHALFDAISQGAPGTPVTREQVDARSSFFDSHRGQKPS